MKKGFSIIGVICIIIVIGLAVFAVLVNRGIIKMNKKLEEQKPNLVNVYTEKETNNDIKNNNENNNTVNIYDDESNNKDPLIGQNEGDEQNKLNEKINFVYSLEDVIQKDTSWCGSFNLVWNMLKNDLAKKDIIFDNMTKTIENLNKGTFNEDQLDEDSYYSTYGFKTKKLKSDIEKAIKEKFNETSDILDSFTFTEDSNDYFLYTMLKKEFKFKYAFDELENGDFGNYKDVKFFGIDENTDDKIRNQVKVLYYNGKDHFAVKLNTKTNDEVLLVKGHKGITFYDIYNYMLKENIAYEGNEYFGDNDTLKVPNLKMDEIKEVKEVENKSFYFADGRSWQIDKALQTIKFELDKTGGKIKSEAAMSLRETAVMIDEPEEIRNFEIDNDFVIFLKEKDAGYPYFAAYISDITKFQ